MQVNYINLDCTLKVLRYRNGRPALRLIDANDGFPVATASINVPEADLGDDEVIIQTNGENEGLLECLVGAGAVELTDREISMPYHHKAPICRLKLSIEP